MNIEKTRKKDLLLIENVVHSDRGNFSKFSEKTNWRNLAIILTLFSLT